MSKKWLILGSVSFSVGLSLNLIISKDLKQAALTGLLSIPATATGVLVTEHQRQQRLKDRISIKQEQLQGLIQQEAELNNSITVLSKQLENYNQQQEDIKASIAIIDADKLKSQTELETLQERINELDNRKSSLEAEINALEIKLQQLQQQETDLFNSKQHIEKELESDRQTVIELRSQKSDLEQDLRDLAIQTQKTTEQLNSQQLSLDRLQQEKLEGDREDSPVEETIISEIINPVVIINDSDLNLSNGEHTKYLWQNIILPHWNHKDRPAGYRFLGNVDIDLDKSDRITDLLKEKFQQSEGIPNYLENNLLKIVTFVLSEYAYYSDEEKFWQGFCDRLGIEHSQTVENSLREITEAGINSLGLIRASGGYRYVSTLWLQSGVPKQNMGHFAAILGDVADEYGWWELSHSSTGDIAEVLWQCWQNRYSQWGTIKHFLKPNNSNQDIEPISGQLVKNIATVARELEYKNLDPEAISDREQREEIIANSNIFHSFFLRDWSDLVVVLNSRHNSNFSRIARRINPEPYLYLDLADTLNTLLILPKQSLWEDDWKNLRGSYCLIPEAEWEDTIPDRGKIEIPELEIDIKQAAETWSLQLQNHHRNEIYSWEHQGINSEFPCLVFDAISGDNIRVNIPDAKIIGIEEIIVFTPRKIEIELDNNIEIIDDFVPSSIRGWRGKEIRLTQSGGRIQIQDAVIVWRSQSEAQPKLIGLRLKGKKDIYINAPTFYYPPPQKNSIISYSIEDINSKSIIAKDIFYTYDLNSWNSLDLSHYIKRAGNYYATFWHQEKQCSYKFEVCQKYQVIQHRRYRNLEICDCNNNPLSIPTKYTDINKFWAEEIKLNNLYPFEELSFCLKSNSEKYKFQNQADSQGKLTLSLATLYGRLLQDDCYSLDVKKSGLEFQRLLQIGYLIGWKLTAKQLIFSEISPADNYCLSGWNLLNPNLELETIDFSLSNSQQTTVELSFSPGIYLIQLNQNEQKIENIGLWCNIDSQNIPDEINNNEALANYCYTILDNEPLADFSAAIEELEVDFDRERIQIILESLYSDNYYLPQWLDKDSLTEKIQKILASLLQPETLKINNIVAEEENRDEVTPASTISGQWCLVTVRPYKRELFIRYLNSDIEQQQLQQLILEIIAPEESVYSNMILLRITNFAETRTVLQQIDYFQAVGRLELEQVNRMLNR